MTEPAESLAEMKARARLQACVCPYMWTEDLGGFAVRMWVRDGDGPGCPVHSGERDGRGPESRWWRPVSPAAWVWDPARRVWCAGEVQWWVWHEGRLWGLCYWWAPEVAGRFYRAVPRRWIRERSGAGGSPGPGDPPAD